MTRASPRDISPFAYGAPETMSSSTSFSLACAIALSPTFSSRFSTITRSPTWIIHAVRDDDLCHVVALELEHGLQLTSVPEDETPASWCREHIKD